MRLFAKFPVQNVDFAWAHCQHLLHEQSSLVKGFSKTVEINVIMSKTTYTSNKTHFPVTSSAATAIDASQNENGSILSTPCHCQHHCVSLMQGRWWREVTRALCEKRRQCPRDVLLPLSFSTSDNGEGLLHRKNGNTSSVIFVWYAWLKTIDRLEWYEKWQLEDPIQDAKTRSSSPCIPMKSTAAFFLSVTPKLSGKLLLLNQRSKPFSGRESFASKMSLWSVILCNESHHKLIKHMSPFCDA